MQDTLNFSTTTATTAAASTTRKLLKPNFLPKTHNSPAFLRRKTTNFPTLSSKTTTIHPLKPPSKIQPLPPSTITNSTPKNVIPTSSDPEFKEKILFLDSIGLDSLSLLPPSAVAAASSLSDLKTLFDYLTSLGFSTPKLRRIITMCPEILSLRLRNTAPVFAFLLREVKVPASDLPRVICRRPRLLVSNVETRLRPTLYFLQSIGIHEPVSPLFWRVCVEGGYTLKRLKQGGLMCEWLLHACVAHANM